MVDEFSIDYPYVGINNPFISARQMVCQPFFEMIRWAFAHYDKQQCLYFLPLPHGQRELRPTFFCVAAFSLGKVMTSTATLTPYPLFLFHIIGGESWFFFSMMHIVINDTDYRQFNRPDSLCIGFQTEIFSISS